MDQLLRHHGDVDAAPGLVDFAVNVRGEGPPAWLRERLVTAVD
ncbi:MAG: Rv2231c family pyridoxal phosphate-dependent protein CobC, partial [Pseudonocardiaceae bacterium]